MDKSCFPDAFKETRENIGVSEIDDQNDPVKMVLRLKDVRKGAHNWKTFQSGAKPGRIVVPSEVAIRDTRQIPFEVDPPEHKGYRDLVEPWFKRPNEDVYQTQLKDLVMQSLNDVFDMSICDVVSEFALPLQSRALTLLLNTPMKESDVWIGWGTHVFRSEGESLDGDKASVLYDYIDAEIERAAQQPCDDLYSLLLASEANGKRLSKEEVKGVMILTFAGGRDTVINAITNCVSYFAEHPEKLIGLKDDKVAVSRAVEELVRYFSPLTHMGRVATENAFVCEHAVKSDSRISLCWASANRDEQVFDKPNEVNLERKVNPHVAFGFGTHNCLGATHARQLLRTLVACLADKVESIVLHNADENIEQWGDIARKVGFDKLQATFTEKD